MDQVLFWNTDGDSRVTLTTRDTLPGKVLATQLLGGHVLVRPAELFEADQWFFDDATKDGGWLFELHRQGHASLALDPPPAGAERTRSFSDDAIHHRADWRFAKKPGFVTHCGTEVRASAREYGEIQRLTYTRAKKLSDAGWLVAPSLAPNAPPSHARRQTLSPVLRDALQDVGELYIGTRQLADSAMGLWLQQNHLFESRGDIAYLLDTWKQDVSRELPREDFVHDAKLAMTLASAGHDARRLGGRISPLLQRSRHHFAESARRSLSGLAVEAVLARLVPQVLADRRSSEHQRRFRPFCASIAGLNAREYAGCVDRFVGDGERNALEQLLYGESGVVEPSLADYVRKRQPMSDDDIVRAIERRLEEWLRDRQDSAVLFGFLVALASTTTTPHLPTLLSVGLGLAVPTLQAIYALRRPVWSEDMPLLGIVGSTLDGFFRPFRD